VLRQLCGSTDACDGVTDRPVRLVRRLVHRTNRDPVIAQPPDGELPQTPIRIDGPALFDQMISLSSFAQKRLERFPGFVKRALGGHPGGLVRQAAKLRAANLTPADSLSWGLHTATICSDTDLPWEPDSDRRERRGAARAAAHALGPSAFGPFDPRTAAGNGLIETCVRWQAPAPAPPPAPGPLPDVPTLFLSGAWDLSTPLADAREEASRSPDAELVVVPHGGHSTITSQGCAQQAVALFFSGRPVGDPCGS